VPVCEPAVPDPPNTETSVFVAPLVELETICPAAFTTFIVSDPSALVIVVVVSPDAPLLEPAPNPELVEALPADLAGRDDGSTLAAETCAMPLMVTPQGIVASTMQQLSCHP